MTPVLKRLLGTRFFKFGVVGGTGTVVNVLALYVGKEWIFSAVPETFHGVNARLDVALLFSIGVSILNNYILNSIWTWKDRGHKSAGGFFSKLPRYAALSWMGVGIQFVVTKVLIHAGMYYLLASLISIILASGVNFVANDKWTFKKIRRNANLTQ
ncbi:GtrA family protein [Paraburkholderia bannensis]|uniref:GtrA family protein n=1 Tax=Paraburkholderia bannensis TaxID=765414 RepID=UPI002AC34C21|nr:GtrA family protein [Paraburkholderia bannensis]